MVKKDCAICGKNSRSKILFKGTVGSNKVNEQIFSARRLPDKLHYQINKCLNCGLILSSPILEQGKIDLLYKKSHLYYSDLTTYAGNTYLRYFQKQIDFLPKNAKLLDIGCGNGFFIESVRLAGIKDVYGVEPSKDAVARAKKYLQRRIKNDVFKRGLYPESSFDFVTCFQTLDHISNPNDFLRGAGKILKKNGIIFFIVHDTEGLSVKLFGEKSPIFDIEHIYLFNKNNLKQIFQMNGFYKIKVFPIRNRYPLLYWMKMAPLPQVLKILLMKFLKSSGLGKIPIVFNAGNIGIIASKS